MASVAPPPQQQPQYTVLRIKRKRTDAPLSSLVISNDDEKEKRRKRRDIGGQRSRGVFRLAETVPQTWKGHGEEGEVLKTRIEGLLSGSAQASPATPATPTDASAGLAGAVAPPIAVPGSILPPTQPPAQAPVQTLAPRPAPSDTDTASSAPSQTQYRVVPRIPPPARDSGLPPRVITLAEIEAARSALIFVDAQAVSPSDEAARSGLPEDPEMAAFLPMLNEYLKLGTPAGPPARDEEDDYVYDLYYRDLRTNALDGTEQNMGALLGYEDLSPPSTPPDSEPEDEADEDSNDEDYYRNDYPEDEDADEDMEGFHDAYSDGEWSRSEGEDGDGEQDPWSYR